jgi:hypothetical protein
MYTCLQTPSRTLHSLAQLRWVMGDGGNFSTPNGWVRVFGRGISLDADLNSREGESLAPSSSLYFTMSPIVQVAALPEYIRVPTTHAHEYVHDCVALLCHHAPSPYRLPCPRSCKWLSFTITTVSPPCMRMSMCTIVLLCSAIPVSIAVCPIMQVAAQHEHNKHACASMCLIAEPYPPQTRHLRVLLCLVSEYARGCPLRVRPCPYHACA